MHALVTGGTGFIGSHLVDALLEEGYEVTCTVRKTSNLRWLQDPRIRTHVVGWDSASFAGALEGVTHVFHVAGLTQAPNYAGFLRGNRDLTRSLADACRGRRIKRFVHISSLAASGPSMTGQPRTESDECRPISMYGRSKLAGEIEARRLEGEIPLTIIRPPVVYGPRDTGVFELFKLVGSGVRPTLGRRKRYSIIHIRDLIRGTLAAFAAPPDTFFITNDGALTSDRFIGLAAEAMGARGLRFYVSDGLVVGIADLLSFLGMGGIFNPDKAKEMVQSAWVCSGAKAQRVLGFTTEIPLEQGFRDTAAWYVNAQWL